jgi:hypothetical protein
MLPKGGHAPVNGGHNGEGERGQGFGMGGAPGLHKRREERGRSGRRPMPNSTWALTPWGMLPRFFFLTNRTNQLRCHCLVSISNSTQPRVDNESRST